ncbi:MAG: Gfo/Idh/MocA family oxidoreductase [Bacteroidota bacterium]
MKKLRFAIIGCGFWSQFQLAAWLELEGVECVALYNRTLEKATALADRFGVPKVYDDIDVLLAEEQLDFVDIVSNVETHLHFVEKALQAGISKIICQKPMGPDLEISKKMLDLTIQAGADFYIHENYRWEKPIQQVKKIMETGEIGTVFKGRISFLSGYPVFDNQPFLAELDKFILTDMGSHILDVVRFLFGECRQLFCNTQTVNPAIKGEDVATLLMRMHNGTTVYSELSYASVMEHDCFTTLYAVIEGDKGSIALGPHNEIRVTTLSGTRIEKVDLPYYEWADPDYQVIHTAIVPTNQDILWDMQGKHVSDNRGVSNFETVKLVWAAYASAEQHKAIDLDHFA